MIGSRAVAKGGQVGQIAPGPRSRRARRARFDSGPVSLFFYFFKFYLQKLEGPKLSPKPRARSLLLNTGPGGFPETPGPEASLKHRAWRLPSNTGPGGFP